MNDLIMRRGDTSKFKFKRVIESTHETIMEKVDKMYVTVKYGTEIEPLFQKTLDNGIKFDENTGYYYVVINPEDTNGLPFGEYVYDIERIVNGEPYTPVYGRFILKEEATYAENEV